MGLEELKSDIKGHAARIAAINFTLLSKDQLAEATKRELDNILALMEAKVDAIEERAAETDEALEDLAGAVDELIDQDEDVLHPETTAKIVGVFEIGKLVAKELESLTSVLSDDTRKKRIAALVKSYRAGVEAVTQIVVDVTLELDDGDDKDDSVEAEDPEGDGDEDEDEDGDEPVNEEK